jgi:hypothetical protein
MATTDFRPIVPPRIVKNAVSGIRRRLQTFPSRRSRAGHHCLRGEKVARREEFQQSTISTFYPFSQIDLLCPIFLNQKQLCINCLDSLAQVVYRILGIGII